MKTYEMLIENELTDGVFGIGLVDEPAIEINWITLSKQDKKQTLNLDIKLSSIDNEKRIVTGPILVPNKQMFRLDKETGEEFNIIFSKPTIEKISQNFLINNYKDNYTLQHAVKVNKLHLVESWIVEDLEKDKSNYLNIKLNDIGTWMGSVKVNDDELWNEYIKTGILRGFSIEGHFTWKSINMNIQEPELDDETLLNIRTIISKTYFKKKKI